MSSTRPRRSFVLLSFALPVVLADAGPRCGGGNRPRPEPTPDASDTSHFAASPAQIAAADGDLSSDVRTSSVR